MKKIVALTLALALAAGLPLTGCAMDEDTSAGKREVNICSWGE